MVMASTETIQAQIPSGPPEGASEVSDSNKPDSIPLDGGLAILLIGAAAFGVKKLRDNKKELL